MKINGKQLKMYIFMYFLLCTAYVESNNFLIKQGLYPNGSAYLYSPYVLWNEEINLNSATLNEPVIIRSSNGKLDIFITTEAVRVKTELFSFNTRVYCYNAICSIPGPTIYVSAGDSIKITLENRLHNISTYNVHNHANRTNIFINGLHLDSSLNNPFRFLVGNNDSMVYEYTIPADQMSGTHWYQSRVNGVGALHTMGGLFGALIVQPKQNGTFSELPTSLSSLSRQLLVFSHIMVDRIARDIEGVRNGNYSNLDADYRTSSLSYAYLSNEFHSDIPLNISYYPTNVNTSVNATIIRDAWLTNGQYQPTYTTLPGQWVLFDLLAASGDRILEIEVRTAVGFANGVQNCTMKIIALDGIYLTTSRVVTHLTLLQSSRATVALMCSTSGVHYLQTVTSFDTTSEYHTIGDHTTKSNQNLLILNVTGTVKVMDSPPDDLSGIFRPNYINSLLSGDGSGSSSSDHSVVDFWSIGNTQMGAGFQIQTNFTDGTPCDINTINNDNKNSNNTINSSSFWFGTGSDCRLPCYEDILCVALYGRTADSHYNGIFNISEFPTVQNGDCNFGSFNQYYNASFYVNNVCTLNTELNSFTVSNQQLTTLIKTTTSLYNTTNVHYTNLNRTQEISFFSHQEYAYPIQIQNNHIQIVNFTNVNTNMSNIVQSSEYEPIFNLTIANHAQNGDWLQTVPALMGKTTFRLKNRDFTGHVLIMSSYLKFEDRGLLSEFIVQSPLNYTTPTITPPTNTTTNSSTPVDPNSVYGAIGIHPPQALYDTPDSAPLFYRCNVSGHSWLYNETINITANTRTIVTNSCPNHYSVCQSAECGGSVMTRALIQRRTVVVPLYPGFNRAGPQDVTCSRSPVGIALNGVGFYSQADGLVNACRGGKIAISDGARYGRTICEVKGRLDGLQYCGDVVSTYGRSFDKCGGYEDDSGYYKYHTTPSCLLAQLSDFNVSGHSAQVGWALDGFPIYGATGPRNVSMAPCGTAGAHPQLCLDNCNGYFGKLPGFDDFMYRYYLPGEVSDTKCSEEVQQSGACTRVMSKCCASTVPSTQFRPYTLGCLRGCKMGDLYNTCHLSSVRGFTSTYLPSVISAPRTVYASPHSDDLTAIGDTDADWRAARETTVDTTFTITHTATTYRTNPLTRAISILNFTHNSTITTTTTTSAQGVTNSSVKNGLNTTISDEKLIQSTKDAFITGMVRDHETNILYYTTQKAIFSYNEITKVTTNLIAGWLEITIKGYNLGASLSDINSIKINGSLCTSVLHVSRNQLKCISVKLHAVSSNLTAADVQLSTIGGNTQGIYLNAQTIVRSGSGRPAITSVTMTSVPFTPYALHLVSTPSISTSVENTVEKTLYWSNVAVNAYNVQRGRVDGSQVETVINNVQKALSLQVLPVLLDSQLNYLSLTTTSTSTDSSESRADSALLGLVRGGQVRECKWARSPYSGDIKRIHTSSSSNTDSSLEFDGYSSFYADNNSDDSDSAEESPIEALQHFAAQDSNCVIFGHVLLFVDAQQSVLVKTALPLIDTNRVFVRYVSSEGLVDSVYYTAFQDQESDSVVSDFYSSLTLLRGVYTPRSIAVEMTSRQLYLTLNQGLLFRLQMDFLLAANISTFLSYTYNTTLTTTVQTINTTTTHVSWNFTMTSQNHTIIDNTTASHATIKTVYASTPIANYNQYTLNTQGLLRNGAKSVRQKLPSWIRVLYTAQTKARFSGVTATKLINVATGARNGSFASWDQQRILWLDANQQYLYASTEAGFPTSSVDLAARFGIYWSSQILFAHPTGSVSGDVWSGPSHSTEDDRADYVVYISEQLGRIWRMNFTRNKQGEFLFDENITPTLLVDLSRYPASIRLRELLNQARSQGTPGYQTIFNELF